jgi:hypothetical protein
MLDLVSLRIRAGFCWPLKGSWLTELVSLILTLYWFRFERSHIKSVSSITVAVGLCDGSPVAACE